MAFPAELQEEIEEENEADPEVRAIFDSIECEEDIGDDNAEALIQEAEMLEEVPLPGRTQQELERKREWLKLPRSARASIRRMHNQFGHCLKEPLIAILRAAKVPDSYVRAAKHFRCVECERVRNLPKQTNKVAMPQPYIFNEQLGVDQMVRPLCSTTR